MATYSLEQLTSRMYGKSVTRNWDAVVFMGRDKVNSLLEQQYVNRSSRDSFLKPIDGTPAMTTDGQEVLQLSALRLGHPRLGFGKASLRTSRVTATLPIVSGSVSYVIKGDNQTPGRILYSYEVSANQGFNLTMDIDLAQSQGTVNEQGRVLVDIGEGYDCRCNLVSDAKGQQDLGDFFKALFLAQKPEDRVYELGILEMQDADRLAPRSFAIRTMATDEPQARGPEYNGDGAVVMLVCTKGNPDEGDDVSDGAFDYLIPNDRHPQTNKPLYSGALVLASRVGFDWFIQYPIQDMVGHGLSFERITESNDIARSLKAATGRMSMPAFHFEWFNNENRDKGEAWSVGEHHLKFYSAYPDSALRVLPTQSSQLAIKWTNFQKLPYLVKVKNLLGTKEFHSDADIQHNVDILFDLVVDPSSNSLSFVPRTPVATFSENYKPVIDSFMSLELHGAIFDFVRSEIQPKLREYAEFFRDAARFKSFGLPEISVLSISNLLFPQSNALQLTQARLPGDLAMFGQINPKETTFTIDPLLPVVKAGDKQDFSIRKLGLRASAVTWGVRSVNGSRAVGTIVESGDTAKYEAPDALLLDGSAVQNVITATYTDPETGKEVTASALVTVVLESLVVTPSLLQMDMGDDKRQNVTLKATSLSGSAPTWKLLGDLGTLTVNGNEATYTRPTTPIGKTLESVQIEVRDGTSVAIATILLRDGNFSLRVMPLIQPGLPAGGSTLLSAPSDIPGDMLTWSVVAGEGSVKGGLFTAPNHITQPYSVVKCTVADVVSGYCIIHLSKHARQSSWYELDIFEFVVSTPPTVYANGLQQAKVEVRIKPTDVDGNKVELSDTEFNSIRLVSAVEKNPLPEVGTDGVPVGGSWYYTEEKGDYMPYPGPALTVDNSRDPARSERTKEFYVQCHNLEGLKVSARITSDSHMTFYSNPSPLDDEGSKKLITLYAVEPPEGGTVGGVRFTLNGPNRVPGDGEDDVDLNTVDYYYLRLLIKDKQVDIKKAAFNGHKSIVKWESDSLLEDVHSITGYAFPGDKDEQGNTKLHFDDILWRRMKGVPPKQIMTPGSSVKEGEIMISLHRREYWQYDRYVKSDFEKALNLIVHDQYGNEHRVAIGFDGVDRNRLSIVGQ